MRQQRLCHAPHQTGDMPRDHDYYRWYCPDTKAALCTMMSLRMMPRSLLPRPNITRGLKNAKLVNLEKEVCYRGS
ncbi:hypothetical protein CMV_008035 [Castanea mollissima]|uniref:Uncharacterized protein n=1 Tax=Castanea mollissima TaxID=60419 RepID=A0A8J4W2E0_9ROSI|nr:hypothetical protein CMV_008035 [Castanea mollissima]